MARGRVQTRDAPPERVVEVRRERRFHRPRLLRLLFGLLAGALIGVLALAGGERLFGWSLFGSHQTDRSGPAVLTAVRDLSEYHAAAGEFQIVIDLQNGNHFVPSILVNRESLLYAIGSVDAYVNLGKVGPNGVLVSSDRRSVTLRLPHAQLSPVTLDPKQSRIVGRNLGLIDRLGDLFSNTPSPQDQQLWVLAQQKIGDAARSTGLAARAETNTRTALARLLRSLGFTTVHIDFVTPTAG